MPEIVVVEDMPSTPPPPVSSRDITSANRHSTASSWAEPETPTRRDLSDSSPLGGGSPWRGLRRDRRESDMSALSADFGLRHTYVLRLATDGIDADWRRRDLSAFRDSSSFSVDDDHDVLASIQNSSWGGGFWTSPLLKERAGLLIWFLFFRAAMMLEAEEEEQNERR